MDAAGFASVGDLVGATYAAQAQQARHRREQKIRHLLQQVGPRGQRPRDG